MAKNKMLTCHWKEPDVEAVMYKLCLHWVPCKSSQHSWVIFKLDIWVLLTMWPWKHRDQCGITAWVFTQHLGWVFQCRLDFVLPWLHCYQSLLILKLSWACLHEKKTWQWLWVEISIEIQLSFWNKFQYSHFYPYFANLLMVILTDILTDKSSKS